MSALARFDQHDHAKAAEPASAEYLSFLLGNELFAINILSVKEIIEATDATTVPMMPACLIGVINLRGEAVPVMDLSLRVGRAATLRTRRSCIIIAELAGAQGAQRIGVMADAVNAVLAISPEQMAPAPSFGGRNDFLEGMAKLDGKFEGRFAMLLNVQQVLSPDDLGAAAMAAAQAQPTGAIS